MAARLDAAVVLALAVGTLASRLLVRSAYLYNWDSIQYALGVQRFNVVAHRPHPPGYFGYILLGRLFTAISGGNPELGLTLLSGVAEALAVALIFLAARAAWGRFAGVAAALLFATSPLAWIYGGVALNYALEPLFAVLVTWLCLRACGGERRSLVLGAATVALAGAIRPTDELFLAAPLAVAAWTAWRRQQRRTVLLAAVALTLATAAWLVPLLVASGGVGPYVTASAQLSARASGTSAVWKAGLGGVARNGTAVVAGLATALGLLVPLGAAYLVTRRLPGGRSSAGAGRHYNLLALAMLAPALAVYVLVHIGQLGYLLLLLPTLILPAGMALESLARVISARHAGALKYGLLAVCAVANVAIFALPPGGMRDQVVQHDANVATLLEMVRRYDPATTLLVTSAEADGSYRLAQYYLSDYPVVALGRDRRHDAGEMFALPGSRGWQPTAPEYDLGRFDRAGSVRTPKAATTILFLDRGAIDLVGDRSDASVVLYGDNWRLWSISPAPAAGAIAAGPYIYFDATGCPCRGAALSHPVPEPHQPL